MAEDDYNAQSNVPEVTAALVDKGIWGEILLLGRDEADYVVNRQGPTQLRLQFALPTDADGANDLLDYWDSSASAVHLRPGMSVWYHTEGP